MENCHVEPIVKQATPLEQAQLADGHLLIRGMGCPNCAARVRNSLLSLEGVVDAIVDHNIGAGRVIYNPTLVTSHELEGAVRAAGGDGRHEYSGKLVPAES
jgi:copper chaperone CopZ